MTTYPIRSGRAGWGQWVLGTVFMGAIFAMTVLPILTGDAPRAEWLGRIGGFVVFLLIGVGAYAWERRQLSEIRVSDDGTIQLVRRNGQVTSLTARDVRELEGEYSRDYDGNYTIWGFSLRAAQGNFRFGEFPDVMGFVEWVRTHHPGVRIAGVWPMGPP